MKVKQIQSLGIIGLLTLVSICGTGYLYSKENSMGNGEVILQDNSIDNYSIDKIRPSDDARNLIQELTKLKSLDGINDKIYIDEIVGESFNIEIPQEVLSSKSDIQKFLDSEFCLVLEKYIGEEFKEDVSKMLNTNQNDEDMNYFKKVYTGSNVVVEYHDYKNTYTYTDRESGVTIEEYNTIDTETVEKESDVPEICIQITDYIVDQSKCKEVDKMIRGDGYRLKQIDNTYSRSNMDYRDLKEHNGSNYKYITDQEEVRMVLDADILVGENEVEGATFFAATPLETSREVQLASYQKDLISRIVGVLKIEEAEETIQEVILNQSNQEKEQLRPIKLDGDGYSLAVSGCIRNNEYHTRIDIIMDNE